MAVPTAYLPLAWQRDGRWYNSDYDANNNLIAYPLQSVIATSQAATFSVWASATRNVTAGPEVAVNVASSGGQLIVLGFQNQTFWAFQPNVPVALPSFLYTILTATNSPYTVG